MATQKVFGVGKSVKDYYNKASFGKLDIALAAEGRGVANDGVVGWIRLNENRPDAGR